MRNNIELKVLARTLAFFCPSLLYTNTPSLFLSFHMSQILIITIAFYDISLSVTAYIIFMIAINLLYTVNRNTK